MPQLELFTHCNDCGTESAVTETNRNGQPYCQECYGERYIECDGCSEEVDRSDRMTDEAGNDYCCNCYNDRYTSCSSCSCECDNDDIRSAPNGECYCESCYDQRYFTCADCEEETRRSRYGNDSENADGERICDSCSSNYVRCAECDNVVSEENSVYRDSHEASYCYDCDPGEDDAGGPDFEASHFYLEDVTEFDVIGSQRTYGVELETSRCPDYADLDGATHFGAKEDGSISGKEFVSAVLKGNAGLDAITTFCKRANGLGFEVDNACGFHAHFGVAELSDAQRYAVTLAYALTQSVWQSFVTPERRRNTYCGDMPYSAATVRRYASEGASFSRFVSRECGTRYVWFNLAAFTDHYTFEVRLHTATLNPEKINNWIIAHTRFIDAVAEMSIEQVVRFLSGSADDRFNAVAELWGSGELERYYRARAEKFGTRYAQAVALPCGIA